MTARTIVRGRYVVCHITGRDSAEVVRDGAALVENGAIIEVGRADDIIERHPDAEVIGSDRHALIPGLINAHHHVGLTPFQMGVLDEPLETWIPARWAIRDIDPYLDTLWCAIQMIESGVTTVQHNHMASRLPPELSLYDGASRVVDAYSDSGMRVAFSLIHRERNNFVYEDDELFLSTLPPELAERARSYLSANPLTRDDYLDAVGDLHSNRSDSRTNIFVSPHNVPHLRRGDDISLQRLRAPAWNRTSHPPARDDLPAHVRNAPLERHAARSPEGAWRSGAGGVVRARRVAVGIRLRHSG